MKTVIVQSGQSVEDIAIQEYGTVDAGILILIDNNLSIDTDLYPGQVLQIRDDVPELTDSNKQVKRAIDKARIAPNSSVVGAETDTAYVLDDYMDSDYVE